MQNSFKTTMKKKLFISFLGTGKYKECTYFYGNQYYKPNRFIQCATLERINAKKWTKDDVICIFVTQSARDFNWGIDPEISRSENAVVADYQGLRQELENMGLKAQIKPILVDDGKNEQEIRNIFRSVYKAIGYNDNLYLDLTHGFRYLPMMLLVMSNYVKFLKEASVEYLSYGNWEAKEERIIGGEKKFFAPIIDLKQLTNLQEWTIAAADFLDNGRSGKLEDLSMPTILEEIKTTHEQGRENEDNKNVKQFVKALSEFTRERQNCRGDMIENGETLNRIESFANTFKKSTDSDIDPLMPMLSHVATTIHNEDSEIKRILDAVDWCCEKGLYQQATTMLQEGTISYFFRRHRWNVDLLNDSKRKIVNYVADFLNKKEDKKVIPDVAPDDLPYFEALVNDEQLVSLTGAYCKLKSMRNTFDHAGFNRDSGKKHKPVESIKDISELFRSVLC